MKAGRSDPQSTLPILGERRDPVVWQACRGLAVMRDVIDVIAVVAVQAVLGAEPKESAAVLRDGKDAPLRDVLVSTELSEEHLRRRAHAGGHTAQEHECRARNDAARTPAKLRCHVHVRPMPRYARARGQLDGQLITFPTT
jgi:hypothetical protein